MNKFNYMLEIGTLRNSSLILGVKREGGGSFKGLGVQKMPRHPAG